LPIGLSFHTFQSLSYVVEVYRGKQVPERNLGIYSLYVMFYPQLVAGPIERPQNLLHQFREDHKFEIDNLARGLRMILWGLFQKMVIADRCAAYVNHVYSLWSRESGLALLCATLLFAVQIYADFAGYSSIAIGCARVMGFKLMTNFNHPYFARSFSEFWKRWHISLSTWFRDYVYIPMGGSRVGRARLYFNLFVTFAISGLWHGANWTFVIWGALNGVFLIVEQMLAAAGLRYPANFIGGMLRRFVVLFGICFAWVFFRAQNLHSALFILHRIATGTSFTRQSIADAVSQFAGDISSVSLCAVTLLLIALMFALEYGQEYIFGKTHQLFLASLRYQFASSVLLFQLVMLFGILRASAFVYFQF
jgi:D-alanyl-lipoteichoic acid acyltransferase DltB (MBOAT superfamily)